VNPLDEKNVRKRILLFYFAAGLNLCMSMYVFAAGAGQMAGGTLALITAIFLAFAGVNFYVARMLRKRLDAQVRQQAGLK
jgi:positive regulator of sigma E activity